MNYSLSTRSLTALEGVHPALVGVVKKAITLSSVDFRVGEGVRSAARQAQLYAQGRTTPGPKVTWVRVSNHQVKPDGFGHAVDLWALNHDGSVNWDSVPLYDAIKAAMFAAANEMSPKVTLRWGADWDRDGVPHEHGETDMAHFELVLP